MNNVSAIILTKNDEANILDCLESIRAISNIIIVDDYSEDRTEEIVKNLNNSKIRFFKRRLECDFSEQRNFALTKATTDWAFFVDSDERVSESLRIEIADKIKEVDIDGYLIKRDDVMWGRRLKFGETSNVKLLRLGKVKKGKWMGKVHETWDINGKISLLENRLTHYPHSSISEFLKEINMYSTIRAEELRNASVKVSFLDVLLYPKAKFILNYIIKLGFLDGIPGFIVAIMMSLHSFLVRSKLWVLTKQS